MKNFLQLSLIFILCLGINGNIYASTSASPTLGGDVDAINSVTYTAVASDGSLENLHSDNYVEKKIGTITIDNNNPGGYKLTFKSANSKADHDDSSGTSKKAHFVLDGFNQDSDATDGKHRNVDGAFIDYELSVWPAGYSTLGALNQNTQTNDYGASGSFQDYHGCFASKADAVSSTQVGGVAPESLYMNDHALQYEHYINFDLTVAPCSMRTGGITATTSYDMDILISTELKVQLLAGNFSDVIEVTITNMNE